MNSNIYEKSSPPPDWAENLIAQQHLPRTYRREVETVVAPLGRWIQDSHEQAHRPIVIGLNGAQGSGKSTLALFLRHWLESLV